MDENLYRSIRNDYSKFVYEILEWDSHGKENMIESGKILKFWNGDSLVFEDEEEMNVLTEFVFYEHKYKNQRVIDSFDNNGSKLSLHKREILRGMKSNHLSVFEITKLNAANRTIELKDQINNKMFTLTDINLSISSRVGMLISTRLIPVNEILMTSGLTFLFHEQKRLKLITELSKVENNLFAEIFRLSKIYGSQVNSIEA